MEQFLPDRDTSYSHIYPCLLRLLSLGTYATAMGFRVPRITFWVLAGQGQATSRAGSKWCRQGMAAAVLPPAVRGAVFVSEVSHAAAHFTCLRTDVH